LARHAEQAPARAAINRQAAQAGHEQQQAHEEAAHAAKLRRVAELRTQSGHTSAEKLAHAQAQLKVRKEAEAAKTKGVQARQTSVRATLKAKGTLLKMTKSGGAVMRSKDGSTYTQSKEQFQAHQKANARTPKGTRRRRTV